MANKKRHFFSMEIIENAFLKGFIYAGSCLVVFIMAKSFFRCKLKVEITGDIIKIKRLLRMSVYIHKKNIVCTREYVKLPRYFRLRYFIITDKSNPKVKIKVTEYYVQNYTEIRNHLRVVPLRSDL